MSAEERMDQGRAEMNAADHVISGLAFTEHPRRNERIEPLPLATARLAASTDGSLRYAISRIDGYGKVPAAQLLDSLGWHPGDRLTVAVERNIAIFQRDLTGVSTITRRRALVMPIATRRACGLTTGDSLLLAAAAQFDVIVAHPPAVLDKMMTLYHQSPDHA
ncbi:hypothetical protein [Actinophytocola sp.]|uniref:hypothetical protein n=1 Tax=Actinophytocola sp. TaxID=1872138 RepID=UPI003D6BFE51